VTRLVTRAALDSDAQGLIALIGAVYDEYPGCVLDVPGEEPDLEAIASAYSQKGGQFWVAVESDRVVGCVGWVPSTDPETPADWIRLCKLYVARTHRRQGLASSLCARVEAAAQARGAGGIELWSDTRFLDAHRFYTRRGYQKQPRTRQLFDRSDTTEYYFTKRS
jgi:putative acetyltransferase